MFGRAAVTVKHLDTGLTRAAEADARGNYSIPALPLGEYVVTGAVGMERVPAI